MYELGSILISMIFKKYFGFNGYILRILICSPMFFLQFENLHMFILLNDGHCIISIKNTTPYIYRLQNYLF